MLLCVVGRWSLFFVCWLVVAVYGLLFDGRGLVFVVCCLLIVVCCRLLLVVLVRCRSFYVRACCVLSVVCWCSFVRGLLLVVCGMLL